MTRQEKRYLKDLQKKEALATKGKKTSKVRGTGSKTSRRVQGEVTEENWEEVIERETVRRKKAKPLPGLQKAQAAAVSAPAAISAEEATSADPDSAMVVSTSRGWCKVHFEGEIFDCELSGEIAAVQRTALAVGDRVLFSRHGENPVVEKVLPRRTKLSRHDPHRETLERVVAANVDVVVHMVSARAIKAGLIDRYLVAIQRGGAQPVICVNKIDLLSSEDLEREKASLEGYSELGVPVIFCSAGTGEGIADLRAALRGKVGVLVGHSGVGKSSTLNALHPELLLATGEVNKAGTGRHVTTGSMLYDLGEGTLLIDTPGIREFGLWQLSRESLQWYFPEFAEPQKSCRYPDCTHTHEPVCGVKEAVEDGSVSSARYDTYVRIFAELA